MSYCFIPGCETNHPHADKVNKLLGKKKSIFKAPRDPEQLEIWRKVLPIKDTLFTSKHGICELHFKSDDIDRYYEEILGDGTVWKMKRGRLKLKKGAVPTIFQNLPTYSKNITEIIENMKSKTGNASSENCETSSKKAEKEVKTSEGSDHENEEEESLTFSALRRKESRTDPEITGKRLKTLERSDHESEEEENLTFSELVRNLESISKPNNLWGITVHDTFLMCAKWDKKYTLKRRLVIDIDLNVKVFLEDAEISFEDRIGSVEEISTLLDKIDSFELS